MSGCATFALGMSSSFAFHPFPPFGEGGLTMLPRRTRILPTQRTLSTPPWRRVAASLIAFALLSVVTFSLASAAGAKERAATQPTGAPKVYQASGHETALAHGVVNLAQLPTITPHAVTSVQTPPLPSPDALTPQQR